MAQDPVVGDVDFPATSGTVTGWSGLLLAAVGLLLVLTEGSGLGLVRGVVALLLFAVLVYAYLLRPRVRIADDTLVLVNPMSTVAVPLAAVSYVSVRSVTKVSVGERTYAAVGVGRRVREMVRPNAEGVMPTPGSWGGRFLGGGRLTANERSPRATETADLLEDAVARAVLQVRDAQPPGQDPPPVRRTWAWGVVAPALVLLAGLLVTLLV